MEFPALTRGTIIRRYKRFLADIRLENGEEVIAHCPNTGRMTGCWEPGAPVELSASDNPKRKLQWTLERVDMGNGWVGVNTSRTNAIIGSFIRNQKIPGLDQYTECKSEPTYCADNFPPSRFDFLLSNDSSDGQLKQCYVEVKNTTLFSGGTIQFPDTVSDRGRKHLLLLQHAANQGFRAVILFAINRPEGDVFTPAKEVDPAYAETLSQVVEAGVEIMAVRIAHTANGVKMGGFVNTAL